MSNKEKIPLLVVFPVVLSFFANSDCFNPDSIRAAFNFSPKVIDFTSLCTQIVQYYLENVNIKSQNS